MSQASAVKSIFRELRRSYKTFTLEIGPLRATGVPAILLGVTGIVLASGITAALAKASPRLPETLSEARGLAETMKSTPSRLTR